MDTGFYLLNRIIRDYLTIGVILYLIIFFYWLDSFNYYNILNVVALLSYAYLLWACVNKAEDYFTNSRLWLTVFIYSLVMVGLYLQMSYFYKGDTFLFSELDAKIYARSSNRLKDLSFSDSLTYLSNWTYDDWGAPVCMAFFLKIIPLKLFVNFCYIVLNSLGAICLYSIGKSLRMTRKYAYLAAMSYAIASYSLFYMGSFLKEELLCFLVITSFYFLYRYRCSHNLMFLAVGGLLSVLLIFFRVPIALFVWISYSSILLLGDKSHIKRTLFLFLFAIVAIFSIGLVLYSSTRYANSGDVASSYQYVNTTLFQKIVSSVGALVGSFPDFISNNHRSVFFQINVWCRFVI